MIRRAATSAARRVCSMVSPASKSVPSRPTNCLLRHRLMDPQNQFYDRDASLWTSCPIATGDAFVKYTAFESLQASSKMESHNDKPFFFVSRFIRGYYVLTPISLEDDGSLSAKFSIRLPFQSSNTEIYMLYSCNGIFCYQAGDDDLAVWNPTTLEARKLPNSPHNTFKRPNSPHNTFTRVSADRFRKVNIFIASWADPKSEDYKVIRFYSYVNDADHENEEYHLYPLEIELYSLKTDSWKKMICCEELITWGMSQCYINGVIYMTPILDKGLPTVIISFDFRSETFSTLPLPDFGTVVSFQLVKYKGQLSVLSCTHKHNDKGFVVHWVMRNGEWVSVGQYHICGVDRPLGFARNDELLLFESVHLEPEPHTLLMVFDSTTGELNHVPGFASIGLELFEFAETFVKLKSSGEQEKEDGRTIEAQVA